MMAATNTLPATWHLTLAEAAAELGVHPDRVLRYADIGFLVPAVLIPRTSLSLPDLAPAPYVIVPLHDYLDMLWAENGAGDLIAPIVGAHRVYQVDGTAFTEVDFDASIIVRRSELVFLSDGIEALRQSSAQGPADSRKPPHPAKVRTLQQMLGLLISERWPDAGPYTVAEALVRGFQLRGAEISKECAAGHVKECRSQFEATGRTSNNSRLQDAA